MNRDVLKSQLERDEDLRLKPYRCTAGKLTIGVGRNLEDRGIKRAEAYFLLDNDIDDVVAELTRALPWFERLDEVRQHVLINMGFNLGVPGLLEFRRTLAAIECGDYTRAASEMLESKWAKQVGDRAIRLSEMMLTGRHR